MSVALYPPPLDAIRPGPYASRPEHRVQFDDIAQMPLGLRASIPRPTISEHMDSINSATRRA